MSRKEEIWHKISHAIRDGKFPSAKSQLCFDCGKQAEQYDHYNGYGPGMDFVVQPVCCSCHTKREVARGNIKSPPKFRRLGAIGPLLEDRHFFSNHARYLQWREKNV